MSGSTRDREVDPSSDVTRTRQAFPASGHGGLRRHAAGLHQVHRRDGLRPARGARGAARRDAGGFAPQSRRPLHRPSRFSAAVGALALDERPRHPRGHHAGPRGDEARWHRGLHQLRCRHRDPERPGRVPERGVVRAEAARGPRGGEARPRVRDAQLPGLVVERRAVDHPRTGDAAAHLERSARRGRRARRGHPPQAVPQARSLPGRRGGRLPVAPWRGLAAHAPEGRVVEQRAGRGRGAECQ